jgi:hypothetical protein
VDYDDLSTSNEVNNLLSGANANANASVGSSPREPLKTGISLYNPNLPDVEPHTQAIAAAVAVGVGVDIRDKLPAPRKPRSKKEPKYTNGPNSPRGPRMQEFPSSEATLLSVSMDCAATSTSHVVRLAPAPTAAVPEGGEVGAAGAVVLSEGRGRKVAVPMYEQAMASIETFPDPSTYESEIQALILAEAELAHAMGHGPEASSSSCSADASPERMTGGCGASGVDTEEPAAADRTSPAPQTAREENSPPTTFQGIQATAAAESTTGPSNATSSADAAPEDN